MFRLLAGVVLALCSSVPVRATSYPPVTFTDLVTQADVMFIGEVVDVRPMAVTTRDGVVIKARVVFRVNDPLFGTTAALEVLEFFGGEIGGVGMAIAGMPAFAIGVGRVLTLDGVPVDQPESIGLARGGVTVAAPMRLVDFRDRVRRAVDGARR